MSFSCKEGVFAVLINLCLIAANEYCQRFCDFWSCFLSVNQTIIRNYFKKLSLALRLVIHCCSSWFNITNLRSSLFGERANVQLLPCSC